MPRYYDDEMTDRNAPNPGIAAVLSVLLPGLGQVYCGRLLAGVRHREHVRRRRALRGPRVLPLRAPQGGRLRP